MCIKYWDPSAYATEDQIREIAYGCDAATFGDDG